MPDPIRPISAASFNFDDAPGGDITLDSIFADPPDNDTPANNEPADAGTPEAQAVTPPQPFLKTATGTVYKTVEDAIAGTEHKDALIAKLREQLTQTNGKDPLKPVETTNTPDESYTNNPEKYFTDLNDAVNSKDQRRIMAVQQRFIQEQMAPYAPMLTNVAREQAKTQVSSEVPDFNKFIGSDDYNNTLESFPLLKTSIQQAEGNPQLSGELAQLYRMSHDIYAGRNVPKIVQDAQPHTQVVTPVRPTVSSTPIAPPVATAPPKTAQDARKDTIAKFESQGLLDRRF